MNKICHVTSAHPRYDIRIFEKECTSLAKKGYDVSLIVNDDKEDELKQGVKIVSTQFQPKNRKDRMITSIDIVLKKAQQVDADVYHLHDPELLQIVGKLKKANKKIIFDAHEDTAVQILDKEWIPYPFRWITAKVFDMYERFVLKKCVAVVTVTPALVDKLKKYNRNVVMVTNYPIISAANGDHVETDKKYIFFAGGVSKQWCHDRIIQALSNVSGVKYILAGPAEEGYLEYLKGLDGWEKVEYLGKIPHDQVGQLYQGAIAGMAVNECSQIKGEGTLGNTKLFEVMEAAVPVICTNYRLWKQIVEDNRCGICVKSDDISEIAAAIEYLRTHADEAAAMGKNGRKAIEDQYNWECEERKLFELYEKI